jgi:fluoride exporter
MMAWQVALAAAIGAAARYALDFYITSHRPHPFPWGTFAVNISGSLGLGLLVGWALVHELSPGYRIVLGTGFLGAYTTFSTWMLETVRLLERGEHGLALLNAAGSWVAGTAAAALGLWAMLQLA